jgi:hypothetical protein
MALPTNKRRRGRPARSSVPAFPQDEVKRILIDGEMVPQSAGPSKLEFPGPRALARRYGVSPSTISRFAQKLGLATVNDGRRHRGGQRQPSRPDTVPWDEIERLLVEGQTFRHSDGRLVLVFLELAELASQFGVSVAILSHFAKEQRCRERRRALLARVLRTDV